MCLQNKIKFCQRFTHVKNVCDIWDTHTAFHQYAHAYDKLDSLPRPVPSHILYRSVLLS